MTQLYFMKESKKGMRNTAFPLISSENKIITNRNAKG